MDTLLLYGSDQKPGRKVRAGIIIFDVDPINVICWRVLARVRARSVDKRRNNLSTGNGPIGPEVAPPSVFHGHKFI